MPDDFVAVGGADVKAGRGWKIMGIVGMVGVLALGGATGYLMVTKGSEVAEKNDRLAVVENELEQKKGVLDELERSGMGGVLEGKKDWKTYTTEKLGLSFDYPSDWVVNSGVGPEYGGKYYTVRSPMGLELRLDEGSVGGFGGDCTAALIEGFLKTEASVSGMDGLSVVSTVRPVDYFDDLGTNYANNRDGYVFVLAVTDVGDLGAGRAVRCSESRWFEWSHDVGDVIFGFAGRWDKITSKAEYAQAVGILSSLRQD